MMSVYNLGDTKVFCSVLKKYRYMADAIQRKAAICENAECRLVTMKGKYKFCELQDISENELWQQTIVVVLESPYKEEFDDLLEKPRPAQGVTGCMLRCGLPGVLHKLVADGKINIKQNCRIIIMNAIPYRCDWDSGTNKKTNKKNQIFCDMWTKKKFGEKFYKCLCAYNPEIIFNCCTKDFRGKVQEQIECFIKQQGTVNTHCYIAKHPRSWFNTKHRGFECCNGKQCRKVAEINFHW